MLPQMQVDAKSHNNTNNSYNSSNNAYLFCLLCLLLHRNTFNALRLQPLTLKYAMGATQHNRHPYIIFIGLYHRLNNRFIMSFLDLLCCPCLCCRTHGLCNYIYMFIPGQCYKVFFFLVIQGAEEAVLDSGS